MNDWRAVGNALLLGIGCAIALAATHSLTADRILANASQARRAALAAVLESPAALPVALPDLAGPGAWRLCDATVLARVDAAGYGGAIEILYTFADARAPALVRLTVAAHQETPGIADFLDEEGGWLASLSGRDADSLAGIDTVSGATITSRAVLDRLKASLTDPIAALGAPAPLECPPSGAHHEDHTVSSPP